MHLDCQHLEPSGNSPVSLPTSLKLQHQWRPLQDRLDPFSLGSAAMLPLKKVTLKQREHNYESHFRFFQDQRHRLIFRVNTKNFDTTDGIRDANVDFTIEMTKAT